MISAPQVSNDDPIERICDELEDAGWTPLPQTAVVTSVTGFRAELRSDR